MSKIIECEYNDKLASGEVLMQKIEAYVFNYMRSTIKETVEEYAAILECDGHDRPALEPFKRTVGYMAGTLLKNGYIGIRGSFCIPNDYYMFDANLGKNKAISKLFMDNSKHIFSGEHFHNFNEHIINGDGVMYILPYTLFEVNDYFTNRCTNYFKGHRVDIGSMINILD